MECKTVRASLSDYLDGRDSWLASEEALSIENHLGSCPGCRNLQLELAEIRTAARELPLRTPPRALWTRIVNEIEIEQALASPAAEESVVAAIWRRVASFRLTFSLPQVAAVATLALIVTSVAIFNNRGKSDEMDFTRLQSALIREELNKKAEIDRKMARIEERKASWDPAFRADFERQLTRIEDSIRECRRTLNGAPNDLNQVQRMLDLYEEKRQLLDDVERLKW